MKRFLLFFIFFVAAILQAKATHIVGGEFEMVYRGDTLINNKLHFNYNLSLILYFDVNQGAPGAIDNSILARIFRKRDNRVMRDNLQLDFMGSSQVEYFQPECSEGIALRTNRMFYTYQVNGRQAVYSLSPDEFTDLDGYYLAWERCCRNYSITNIHSQNPEDGAQYAGQTFYLEFPPLKRNGVLFINSSPKLFPPLSDYACPGSYYYVDFAGTDPDGDSMVYSLITPLNTISGDALPPPIFPSDLNLPRPGPYPLVEWQSGFGIQNIMKGDPDLKISTEGLLTVTPTLQGLYVFSVRCEEYRNGIRIGEVLRDFQLLVLAECKTAQSPIIEAKKKGAPGGYVKDNLNVTFPNIVADNDRCVEIRVTDPDSSNPQDGNKEAVHIRAIPLGFKNKDLGDDILPEISSAVLTNGGAATFMVCFPQCPYINGPYQIGIIAGDDACPLPRLDTIIVTVNVDLPNNREPIFVDFPTNVTALEGNSQSAPWAIIGKDADFDSLTLRYEPIGFRFEDYGFQYDSIINKAGEIRHELTLNTRCDVIDFSKKKDFQIRFILNDKDKCDLLSPESAVMNLHVDLIDVHSPTIEFAPDPGKEKVFLTSKIYETLSFAVNGRDVDANDMLDLKAIGEGFNLNNYNMLFPAKTGKPVIQSTFNWRIDCKKVDLKIKDEFALQFIVVDDNNRCGYYLADTLDVVVKVEPPDNLAPTLNAFNSKTDTHVLDKLSFRIDEKIELSLLGVDANTSPADGIKIELIGATGSVVPAGYEFTGGQGLGRAQGFFTWTPDCSIYRNDVYENDYTFTFSVKDDRCFNVKGDTLAVDLKILDIDEGGEDFLPPNWITPNGDNKNDFFAMVKEDEHAQLISILPKDNCAGHFVNIAIYNRWGREVYSSTDRDFKWRAENLAVGVYFYSLRFSNKEYKGTITLRL